MSATQNPTEYQAVKRWRDLLEARDEVERELNVRCRCFPRWVGEGRVSSSDATDRLDRLATALRYLESLPDASPLPEARERPGKPF